MDTETISACSPFGGILYLVCDNVEPQEIEIDCYDVGRYPIYCRGCPAIWEATQGLEAPWGEIETQFVFFTVPTSFMHRFPSKDPGCEGIDKLLSALLTFMCDEREGPYRVIFDVEVPTSLRKTFYPLILPIESLEMIFRCERPSRELIQFLHLIAFRSLPLASLPTNAREALAALAAYSVGTQFWPDQESQIAAMIRTASPLFAQFMKIYAAADKRLFPSAIAAVRPRLTGTVGKGQINYGFFVKRLNTGCARELTRSLLDESVTATRPDVAYELSASENLEEYHMNPFNRDRS
jgi:hypothetical protein